MLVVGLMGLGAGSAQGSQWMVKGANLKEGVLPEVKIKILHKQWIFRVVGIDVKVLCTVSILIGAHLKIFLPTASFLGKLKDTGCTITLTTKKELEEGKGGKVSAACEPTHLGEKGVIETKEFEGPLTLVSGEGALVLAPKSGETLAVIETGEECAIGEEIPIIGKFALKDSGGLKGLETEAKVHTFEEGPGTELWAISKTAEHAAAIQGKSELELASGEVWSGLAE